MVILIAGASHTGKTRLAQNLLEKYKIPYISLDHLKMGLIRSGQTVLTPQDDEKLTAYLWPIVREMIKTAIENHQNLMIEGCYIPFDYAKDFDECYLNEIQCYFLIVTERYIRTHFSDIFEYENVIEKRMETFSISMNDFIKENNENLLHCQKNNCKYILIDTEYEADIDLSLSQQAN